MAVANRFIKLHIHFSVGEAFDATFANLDAQKLGNRDRQITINASADDHEVRFHILFFLYGSTIPWPAIATSSGRKVCNKRIVPARASRTIS